MTKTNNEYKTMTLHETPKWCVDRLFERTLIGTGNWIEPCAGKGAIIKACNERIDDIKWVVIEKNEEHRNALWNLSYNRDGINENIVIIDDFRNVKCLKNEYNCLITNPPFRLTMEVIKLGLSIAKNVVILQRLNFLGSIKRAKFFQKRMPNVFVLPNRPSFTPDGGTDSCEYAWFLWRQLDRNRIVGTIQVLDVTK